MAEKTPLATDEAGATPLDTSESAIKKSPRAFLELARRNLSEEELAAPGARRFMISEIERLDDRCIALEDIAQKYNDLRVEKAVLDEKVKASKWHEVLSGLCLAAGSAGIGASTKFFGILGAERESYLLLTISAVLVIVGIVSKVWK